MLRAIAGIARGRFPAAPTSQDLTEVWEELGSRIAVSVECREMTAAFVVALVLAARRRRRRASHVPPHPVTPSVG
jgi:hypothetical protein